MWSAVALGFADSINALLIAVLVAIGIILPRGQYRKVAALLLIGDWLGVFLLALAVMALFNGLGEFVQQLVQGPVFGIILIVVGIVAAVGTWRSKPSDNNQIVELMLKFLREPSGWTVAAGFILGFLQSLTSAPFYGGIAVLSAGDFSPAVQYGGMFFYACIALSLPTVVGLLIAVVRTKPESLPGRAFLWARTHPTEVTKAGGYVVAAFLIGLGLVHF